MENYLHKRIYLVFLFQAGSYNLVISSCSSPLRYTFLSENIDTYELNTKHRLDRDDYYINIENFPEMAWSKLKNF